MKLSSMVTRWPGMNGWVPTVNCKVMGMESCVESSGVRSALDAADGSVLEENKRVVQELRERREFGRRNVCKQAVAVLEDGTRIPGVVVDISVGGARIQVKDVTLLQPIFLIEIPDDDFVVKCEVVYYLENAAGLRFLESPSRLSWAQKSRKSSSISVRKGVDVTEAASRKI